MLWHRSALNSLPENIILSSRPSRNRSSQPRDMTRVAVIGNAGGGKSTLCREVSSLLGLPYHAIDKIQWLPGWRMMPEAEFRVRHDALVAQERWIIDGLGPWRDIERRFDAADTIVFIDYPFWRHLLWASKRQIRSVLLGRADGPEGCPMWRVTFKLYRMMWWLHRELRPKTACRNRAKAERKADRSHSSRYKTCGGFVKSARRKEDQL